MKLRTLLPSVFVMAIAFSMSTMAQNGTTVDDSSNIFGESGEIVVLKAQSFDGSSDSGFSPLVNWNLASVAAASADPVGLTDVALQLAEAEKIMLRPHGSISTSTLFKLAINAAVKQGDQETLDRLVKGAKQYGLDEIAKEAETSKELASTTRSEGDTNEKREKLLAQLSDDEKFSFWVSMNLVAISFHNPEELKKTKIVLTEDQNLVKAAKDYLLAEVDNRIKEFESLSLEERETLIELASISRQGRVIASSHGEVGAKRGSHHATGRFEIYENGQVKVNHWAKQGGWSGTAYSTYLLTVTERSNRNKIIWAWKNNFAVGNRVGQKETVKRIDNYYKVNKMAFTKM